MESFPCHAGLGLRTQRLGKPRERPEWGGGAAAPLGCGKSPHRPAGARDAPGAPQGNPCPDGLPASGARLGGRGEQGIPPAAGKGEFKLAAEGEGEVVIRSNKDEKLWTVPLEAMGKIWIFLDFIKHVFFWSSGQQLLVLRGETPTSRTRHGVSDLRSASGGESRAVPGSRAVPPQERC